MVSGVKREPNLNPANDRLVELCRPIAYNVDVLLPPHTFRQGDPVRIEGVGKADQGVDGTVYRVTTERIIVATEGQAELVERLRLVKLANSATYDRMDKTMVGLGKLLEVAPPHVEVLLGKKKPEFEEAYMKEWFTDLNDSQKGAITHCLSATEVAAIHGPPGTGESLSSRADIGKTHTLVELIYQLLSAEPHHKILISTPSNLALDNILARLWQLSADPPYSRLLPRSCIVRLGHPTRVQADLIPATLDYQAKHGDDGALIQDISNEINSHLSELAKRRGERGAVKGKDRGKRWEEVKELRREYRQREGKVVSNVIDRARVVLATCHSAGARQLNDVTFDVCIIDEATQAIEAVCWVPILKSRKLVIAGDPKQLPPTIMSKADAVKASPFLHKSLETTLFDRIETMHPKIKRVLTTQYRMHKDIATFPSDTLYESELISDPSVAERTLADLVGDGTSDDPDLTATVIFYDTNTCRMHDMVEEGESTSNPQEAEIVVKWAKNLVELGIEPKDIAIVTPYQAQVAEIRGKLNFPEMMIGSVDGLQGQEREAVILSLVRSNTKGEVGFLSEYRRLNVAMTRAKRQLCVVGDSSTVRKGSAYLEAWIKYLEDGPGEVRFAGDMS